MILDMGLKKIQFWRLNGIEKVDNMKGKVEGYVLILHHFMSV